MEYGAVSEGDQELIAKSATYAPWNIVEGPANGTDDPEDRFDEYRVSLSGSELNRHRQLKVLYHALALFNNAVANMRTPAEAPFVTIANELSSLIGNTKNEKRYIQFRASMWK